jgi:hypothetical protein
MPCSEAYKLQAACLKAQEAKRRDKQRDDSNKAWQDHINNSAKRTE